MKKFLALIFFVPFLLSAQKKFVINGNLNGLPEGSPVSLSNVNIPGDTIAQAIVKTGGSFELRGTVTEPNLYQLNFDGVQKKSVLFIGNDQVNVSGDIQTIQDLNVKESAEHNDFEQFKKIFNTIIKEQT